MQILWLVTPFLAVLSLVIVCVAISTNQWLITEEKMPNPNYNGSGGEDYLNKRTVSGLWTICTTNPGEKEMHCSSIEYFPKEEYSPDPNDSTMAIPYAVTRSAFFFILATVLLFFGEFCCLFGQLVRNKRLYTFISGVVFIISGLLMLIGLVMYISIFKAEIGSKLRPRSQLQPPMFTFQYGYSFLLYVSGFMAIETAGTCAVFLYISWQQKEWSKKRVELHAMNHRRKHSNASTINIDQQLYTGGNKHSYISPLYPCRRHPYYPPPVLANHTGVSPSIQQRRYYLDSDGHEDSLVQSPIARVSNVSTSYYTFAETNDNFDTVPIEGSDYIPRPWDLPRDITTHTVSTTADINSCDDIGDFSPHPDFVTFDLDTVPPIRTPDGRRKDYDSLRRTTPV
ncbi:stargazin-like protein [Lycorma delicatula]|uniref:stargazin-like protein n=1 Tax=Lycorma delicatula TaxID=130591 RepID=UPI003F518EC4